ncbi:MAG: hypothetical protein CMD22_00155 [Flavobacteriales bacterium]|nr:hypothetical protein [Flavobacteriales bacterium]|tara:strand:- start:222 stop:641 length:420 start_codon:yes stop_codon:yes gene_type:complete
MDRDELIKKATTFLKSDFNSGKNCCHTHVLEWVDAVMQFRKNPHNSCCSNTLRSLQHLILEESSHKDYIVRKNAIFGDLFEIRGVGFEKRYNENVSITNSYIEAYEKTEEEYHFNFGKRRYSSYDSFRQVIKRRYPNKK